MLRQSRKKTQRSSKIIANGLALFVAVSLAACGTTKLPASVAGVCEILPKPQYAVLGKTQYDQDMVDEYTVAGATCGHPAPQPRPPELDVPPPVKPPAVKPAPRKRPGFLKRITTAAKRVTTAVRRHTPGFVTPAAAEPTPPPPIPSPPIVVEPTPTVTVKPTPVPVKSPVDDLLDPS